MDRIETRMDRIETRLDNEIGRVYAEIVKVGEKVDAVRTELDHKIESVRSWSIGILAVAVIGLVVKLFLPTL